ncbi:FHA domain-containing protein, partial [Endomicrobium sp. AH-315-J14]|nr:FHA domain-containing protein [Endomicrobium sp. AH-315-J14]
CLGCGAPIAKADDSEDDEPQGEENDESIRCSRCDGLCDGKSDFCKYCGGALDGSDALGESSALELKQPKKKKSKKRGKRAPETPEPPPKAVSEQATAHLVIIVEDGSEGRSLPLHGEQVDIGRTDGDILLEEDEYLSPRHARLYRKDGDWYLRDLDSTNGVFRRLREPHRLVDGDLVLLGLEVLRFERVSHGERGLGHATEHGTLLFGSPAATRRARLCQRTVEGITRDVYHLVRDETTIGREIGDVVFTSDPFMSRRHAVVRFHETTQEYVLADLSSSNGTYLAIREDVCLVDGDFVRVGQHLFRVDLK